jgi:integrase
MDGEEKRASHKRESRSLSQGNQDQSTHDRSPQDVEADDSVLRAGDWIFASPAQLSRLPWSADSVNDAYRKAAFAAGVAHANSHSMRHTYRLWLDAVGTPIAVQQKLMRNADKRTTMNTRGEVVTDEKARGVWERGRVGHERQVNGRCGPVSALFWRKRV